MHRAFSAALLLALASLYALGVLGFWPVAASADDLKSCTSYFDAATAPANVASLLAEMPGRTVIKCPIERSGHGLIAPPPLPGDPTDRYLVRSAPSAGKLGTCYFTQEIMYWRADKWQRTAYDTEKSYPARDVLMTLRDGPCPRQDDAGYIPTMGDVTEGVFVAAMGLWQTLMSGKNLDPLFAHVPISTGRIQLLEMLAGPNRNYLHIMSVKRTDPYAINPSHFIIVVPGFELHFDFAPEGARLLEIWDWAE